MSSRRREEGESRLEGAARCHQRTSEKEEGGPQRRGGHNKTDATEKCKGGGEDDLERKRERERERDGLECRNGGMESEQ